MATYDPDGFWERLMAAMSEAMAKRLD